MHTTKRKRLPTTRESMTHDFTISGKEFVLTVGLKSGQPYELFLKAESHSDPSIKGFCRVVSILISLALQYECPVKVLIEKLAYQDFPPDGITNNKDIPMVKSIADYIGRWMALTFKEPIPKQAVDIKELKK